MNEINPKDRVEVIRLYFVGLSYDEIVEKVGVSKGSVANIIDDLIQGKYSEFGTTIEQIEFLRKLGTELHKSGKKPLDAFKGAILLSKLGQFGLELREFEEWSRLLVNISSPSYDTNELVAAAVKVVNIQHEKGASLGEIPELVRSRFQELNELELKIASVGQSIVKLETESEEKKKSIANQIQKAENSLQEKKQITTAESDRLEKELREKLDKHQLDMEKVDSLLGFISEEVPDVERFRYNVKAYGGLIQTIDNLRSIVFGLEREIGNLRNQKSTCEKDLNAKKIEGEKQKQELEEFISSLQKKANEFEARIRSLDDELDLKKKQHQEELKRMDLEVEKKRNEVTQKITAIETEVKALEQKASSMSNEIGTANAVFQLLQDSDVTAFDLQIVITRLEEERMIKKGEAPRRIYWYGEPQPARKRLIELCLIALKDEAVPKGDYDEMKGACEGARAEADSLRREKFDLELKCIQLQLSPH